MAITIKNKPLLSVPPIILPIPPSLADQNKIVATRYGYSPIAYYNGLPIEEGNIVYFKLESTAWLPILKMTIKDWSSQMKSTKFALDNSTITIFINAIESSLKDILMEFKIVGYDYDPKTDLFYITGWPNVDKLYYESNVAYRQKTSFEVVEQLAQEYKLGFATNIKNTNDKMTWINPGQIAEEFIIRTVHRSYLNDDAFIWSFLDFYYCINFFDVETEMNEDASKQVGIVTASGIGDEETKPKKATEMVFFYGKKVEGTPSNIDITDYEIYNQSTFQSIAQGYRKEIEYYDRTGNWNNGKAGQFLSFKLETNQVSKAVQENIVLKDLPTSPKNDSFYQKNVKFHWLGKFDISNAHLNYNYTIQNNRFNLEELQKIYAVITLAIPNYNVRRFMKIKILLDDVLMTNTQNALNERLSGAWLVVGIVFEKENNFFVQKLIVVRRELTSKNYDI